jgi:hypothetical protein
MSEAREGHLKTYVGVMAAFAVALCASWIYWYGLTLEWRLVVGAAILACFVLLGDIFAVQISERTAMSACAIALMVAVAA